MNTPDKILYIDCSFGAAGDMLTAALLDLFPEDYRANIISKLNRIGIPGVVYEAVPSQKNGIAGTSVKVFIDGAEEEVCMESDSCGEHEHSHNHEHAHHHEHEHHHEHSHVHRGLQDIADIVASLAVSDSIKRDVVSIYQIIAQAESEAHGVPVSDIHFHEVGTMDAIADITAACVLFDVLKIDRVAASPVGIGSGHVHCAHGILPVPAPATALILQGVPVCGTEKNGELCTPTGAAVIRYFASEYGAMPEMSVKAIGYGMGKKDFEWANCVRVMLGFGSEEAETVPEDTPVSDNTIIKLECNLDDMTAEAIGFAMERLYEAGAVEVYTTAVGMKKNRPGTMLTALCHEDAREIIVEAFFKYTTTIGIRESVCRRYTLERSSEVLGTPFGDIRRKHSTGYGADRIKYEYDDISEVARKTGLSLEEVIKQYCHE